MTISERISALAAAKQLAPKGLIVIVETPNRLWVKDTHTSKLPFFDWLPNELAFEYTRFSPRANFKDLYGGSPSPESMEHFLRRGRGVSFHEFELGLEQRASTMKVRSSMQTWRRGLSPMRQLRWTASRDGRFQSLLHSMTPEIHEGFFQPFLYLAIEIG